MEVLHYSNNNNQVADKCQKPKCLCAVCLCTIYLWDEFNSTIAHTYHLSLATSSITKPSLHMLFMRNIVLLTLTQLLPTAYRLRLSAFCGNKLLNVPRCSIKHTNLLLNEWIFLAHTINRRIHLSVCRIVQKPNNESDDFYYLIFFQSPYSTVRGDEKSRRSKIIANPRLKLLLMTACQMIRSRINFLRMKRIKTQLAQSLNLSHLLWRQWPMPINTNDCKLEK